MKKTILLAVALFSLTACATGINHNIATVNGKPYLVETKNRNFFGLGQWSETPTYVNIEDDINLQERISTCIKMVRKDNPRIDKSSRKYINKLNECVDNSYKEQSKELDSAESNQ